MLADIVDKYLQTFEEREFDAPFIALLRAIRLRDIHFLHGSYEFGKDFIARGALGDRVESQFAFQTKAGDLGLAEWNAARGQLDLLRTNSLAHPAFDPHLPRRAILVTTGRLVGGAPLAAQDYKRHLEMLREATFDVWDRDTLVSYMTEHLETAIAGQTGTRLLAVIGQIDSKEIEDQALEGYSRSWARSTQDPAELWRPALETAILAHRLRLTDRLDLACHVSLCLLRAAWAPIHGMIPPPGDSLALADAARRMFRHHALELWARCSGADLHPERMLELDPLASLVTYPVRCLRLVEILGLLGLLNANPSEPSEHTIAEYLCEFFRTHPGGTHPISDRWAVSLVPPVLLLMRRGLRQEVESILERTARWILRCYGSGAFGLARSDASPTEEINYLLGGSLEHVTLTRRRESYVSTVLLDLAAILELGQTFEQIHHQFRATDIYASVVEAPDEAAQYFQDSPGITSEPNLRYRSTWDPTDRWKVAPHHERAPGNYYLGCLGRPWDHLAVSAVLRDRHFLPSCRAMFTASD